MLPGLDEDYEQAAATTADDLAVLAPQVPASTRTVVDGSDPTLDDDLQAWFSDDGTVPRLTLLGPVQLRALGQSPGKRTAFYTELVTYLHTRPHGATPDEVADTFTITPARTRNDIKTARDWLGRNTHTGEHYLPHALHSPAAKTRGVAVYQISGLLTDADLFRRLRIRAQARGADGITDLTTALSLVIGKPLDQLRPGGWTWMYEGDRLDQHLLCAVIDVAHIVTTHSLHTGDLTTAHAAVQTALSVGPDEETTRLDLVALTRAENRPANANLLLDDYILNQTDDDRPPADLPPRTRHILDHDNRWTDRRKAS